MKKEITKIIDNNTFFFECEQCEGQYLDTRVSINNTFFCCISFPDMEQFLKDFSDFMAKHRI